MLARIVSAAVNEIEAYPVEVEVNSGWGETALVAMELSLLAGKALVWMSTIPRRTAPFFELIISRIFNLAWNGSQKLELKFRKALIVHFSNFYEMTSHDLIEIRLVPNCQNLQFLRITGSDEPPVS